MNRELLEGMVMVAIFACGGFCLEIGQWSVQFVAGVAFASCLVAGNSLVKSRRAS